MKISQAGRRPVIDSNAAARQTRAVRCELRVEAAQEPRVDEVPRVQERRAVEVAHGPEEGVGHERGVEAPAPRAVVAARVFPRLIATALASSTPFP